MPKWEEYRPFREWLLTELDKREWKPIDLARRIKPEAPVDVASSISRWMRGERRPDTESCRILADVLGTDIDYVLELAGHKPPELTPEEDEVFRSLVARVKALPPEQVALIDTAVRALHDNEMRRRAETSIEGDGVTPKSKKQKAAAIGQSPMALIPPGLLAAMVQYNAAGAPGARRMVTALIALACIAFRS